MFKYTQCNPSLDGSELHVRQARCSRAPRSEMMPNGETRVAIKAAETISGHGPVCVDDVLTRPDGLAFKQTRCHQWANGQVKQPSTEMTAIGSYVH